MRTRVLNFPRRLVAPEASFPKKRETETGAAYASRLDRLLEPATEATLERALLDEEPPAKTVSTTVNRVRSRSGHRSQ